MTLNSMIEKRAYHLWEATGQPHGRGQEFWDHLASLHAGEAEPPVTKPKPSKPKAAEPAVEAKSAKTISPAKTARRKTGGATPASARARKPANQP